MFLFPPSTKNQLLKSLIDMMENVFACYKTDFLVSKFR